MLALCLCLVGCGQSSQPQQQQTPPEPLDLTGNWDQVNASGDLAMQATIEGETITVYWIADDEDTKSLYWKGSYVAPSEAADTYSWTSEGDTEEMKTALLASTDSTKDFSYKDGQLTYEATAFGTTKTVRLEPVE